MNRTAPSTDVTPQLPTSFVYEDLVLHVQAIQKQIIEAAKFIEDKSKNEKNIQKPNTKKSGIHINPDFWCPVFWCLY